MGKRIQRGGLSYSLMKLVRYLIKQTEKKLKRKNKTVVL
jgi:hypothetical protein